MKLIFITCVKENYKTKEIDGHRLFFFKNFFIIQICTALEKYLICDFETKKNQNKTKQNKMTNSFVVIAVNQFSMIFFLFCFNEWENKTRIILIHLIFVKKDNAKAKDSHVLSSRKTEIYLFVSTKQENTFVNQIDFDIIKLVECVLLCIGFVRCSSLCSYFFVFAF